MTSFNRSLAGIAAAAWLVVAAGTDRVEAAEATWILLTVGDLKSKPPPIGEAATAELAALKTMIANRNASDIAQARWWDVGGPAYRWNDIAVNEMLAHFVTVPLAPRNLALIDAGTYITKLPKGRARGRGVAGGVAIGNSRWPKINCRSN